MFLIISYRKTSEMKVISKKWVLCVLKVAPLDNWIKLSAALFIQFTKTYFDPLFKWCFFFPICAIWRGTKIQEEDLQASK